MLDQTWQNIRHSAVVMAARAVARDEDASDDTRAAARAEYVSARALNVDALRAHVQSLSPVAYRDLREALSIVRATLSIGH